ncbi:MAG: hypothetical protein COX80_00120 [Candidatus Magasanikbacteria bacterium CG_4_10_14_0_2_um_filter_33_14]|uniref:Uncharacterized protein n=1 Tax=Candidatus Magasanikbacteria bacterium CG_4_10_14_0_2_um_filter_33_14 TaxID=1974636 RepID=A0A2M7VC27_9BACT|nr:MAG: hypothetical protein COX80_00120 [Candidatus Magasanikbacteria bacterium CG_4_10_14_0_2_um_filter_33_14]
MKFPENFNLKPLNILKLLGLAIVVIVVIALAIRLITYSISPLKSGVSDNMGLSSPSSAGISLGKASSNSYYAEDASLSVRNVVDSLFPPDNNPTPGDDAENYEVKDYNATIETRDLEDTCNSVAKLKAREDVIFENASKYERSCNYTFKVKTASVEEILSVLKDLDPKELNENVRTIKNVINDYTSEVEILEKKLASIDSTLNNAVKAYDEITDVARKTQDANALAKIIDSKIQIIEKLTQEKINITANLDRLARSKAEQLDRLEDTYFNVYVQENKFVDGQNLKDSWKYAVKSFVTDTNKVIQDVSINLVLIVLTILQYILYFFILLFAAKYVWKWAKYIWKR